ncbi:MAG: hypothetical protein JWO67_2465 [Streptosporangiaceae bacterium]|nr:hypothetical protein [Streptosporangiaceae bacterium]
MRPMAPRAGQELRCRAILGAASTRRRESHKVRERGAGTGTTVGRRWFYMSWPVCPVSPGLIYSLRGLPFGWSRVEPFAERRPAHRYASIEGPARKLPGRALDCYRLQVSPRSRRRSARAGDPRGRCGGRIPRSCGRRPSAGSSPRHAPGAGTSRPVNARPPPCGRARLRG